MIPLKGQQFRRLTIRQPVFGLDALLAVEPDEDWSSFCYLRDGGGRAKTSPELEVAR